MKLVVIQGRTYARYVGRKQDTVILIDDWEGINPAEFVEQFRKHGVDAT